MLKIGWWAVEGRMMVVERSQCWQISRRWVVMVVVLAEVIVVIVVMLKLAIILSIDIIIVTLLG